MERNQSPEREMIRLLKSGLKVRKRLMEDKNSKKPECQKEIEFLTYWLNQPNFSIRTIVRRHQEKIELVLPHSFLLKYNQLKNKLI